MIELKQISFSYPDEMNGSLENIELSVKKVAKPVIYIKTDYLLQTNFV